MNGSLTVVIVSVSIAVYAVGYAVVVRSKLAVAERRRRHFEHVAELRRSLLNEYLEDTE